MTSRNCWYYLHLLHLRMNWFSPQLMISSLLDRNRVLVPMSDMTSLNLAQNPWIVSYQILAEGLRILHVPFDLVTFWILRKNWIHDTVFRMLSVEFSYASTSMLHVFLLYESCWVFRWTSLKMSIQVILLRQNSRWWSCGSKNLSLDPNMDW